jgi:hypothetical protein
MIDIYDKLDIINKRIEAIQVQVDFLQDAIESNPIWNEPEKPSRESVLNNYILRLEALNDLKTALTNQG